MSTDVAERLGLAPGDLDAVLAAVSAMDEGGERDLTTIMQRVFSGESLLDALRLPPQTVPLLYSQAYARFEARRSAEALPLFQALTLLAPDVKDHWLGLALCLRLAQQDEAAAMTLEVAQTLAPEDAAIAFHMVELACHRGRWAEARAGVERFARLPDSPAKARLAPELQRYATAARSRS